nr:hypothetical protein Iba_chr06aCG5350 [Ipomoea batatas]
MADTTAAAASSAVKPAVAKSFGKKDLLGGLLLGRRGTQGDDKEKDLKECLENILIGDMAVVSDFGLSAISRTEDNRRGLPSNLFRGTYTFGCGCGFPELLAMKRPYARCGSQSGCEFYKTFHVTVIRLGDMISSKWV